MTRTERKQPNSHKAGRHGSANEDRRQYNISTTITKLLRHQAQSEKIPITAQGWVKASDLLAWRGLKDIRKFNHAVTLRDIVDAVSHDGTYSKGRFGLRLLDDDRQIQERLKAISVTSVISEQLPCLNDQHAALKDDLHKDNLDSLSGAGQPTPTSSSNNNPETLAAIAFFYSHESEDTDFLIRANQGHSIRAVESEGLLTQITLSDPSTIPGTVVHGTFYGAWELIRQSGGLKPMSRNMVHFATGPPLSDIVPEGSGKETKILKGKREVDEILGKNKVVSGMRHDAQILIYVDLKRCLEDAQERGLDVKWYKSENGVILTEGIRPHTVVHDTEQREDRNSLPQPQTTETKHHQSGLVPLEYCIAVVEVKEGLGTLWQYGMGKVQDLPEHLRNRSIPHGKQGHRQPYAAAKQSLNREHRVPKIESSDTTPETN